MVRESRAQRRYFKWFLSIALIPMFISCRYFNEPEPDFNQAVTPMHVGGVTFVNHCTGIPLHDGDGWIVHGWDCGRAIDVVPDTSGYQIILTGVTIDSTELVRSNPSSESYSPRIQLYSPSNMLLPAAYVQDNIALIYTPYSGTHRFSFTYRIYSKTIGLGTMISYQTPPVTLSLIYYNQ